MDVNTAIPSELHYSFSQDSMLSASITDHDTSVVYRNMHYELHYC